MAKEQKLKWQTIKVKVRDLVPLDFNPRKITPERLDKLKELIKKFDVVEIPVINADGTLITFHQRLKVLLMLGRGEDLIEVRKPNRQLTDEELKQYNLASNTHVGEWDFDILETDFADIDLDFYDIKLPEVGEIGGDENDYGAEQEAQQSQGRNKPTNIIACSLSDDEYETWCAFKIKIGFGSDKKVIFEAIKVINKQNLLK